MRKNRSSARLLILALALPLLPGCLLAAGAAVGAGVVAATSEDTAQVDLKSAPPQEVYDTALNLVENEGDVTSSDPGNWNLTGEIEKSKVTITIFRVNDFTRVRVKARKLGGTLPDLDLAKRIANDISHAF